ncbi:efflux RND transporter periplasmic adaptor subunit [Thermodesulfitimonas sp.]
MRGARFWLAAAAGVLVAAVVAAAVWRGIHPPAAAVKTGVAAERLFEDKVLATGKVEAIRQAAVVAPFAARLLELKVKEGDQVAAGQVVAVFDTADADDRVKEAEAALKAAEAELAAALAPARPEEVAQAEAALKAAEAAAQAAQKRVERYRYLVEQEAASPAELEAAETDYARAQAEVTAAGARLAALKEPDSRRIAPLEARVNQARVALENARRMVAKGRVTVPVGGVVLQIAVKEGDFLQPGAPVLTVGDPAGLRVVADLSEQDVAGVAAGQEAVVTWAGCPGKTWRGKVSRVAPAVTKKTEQQQAENVVRVYIILEGAGLLPGATVDVVIHRVKPHRAVVVPNDAVIKEGGRPVVYTAEKGVARRRPVTLGGANELYTEIRAGLRPDATVILNPKEIKDGQPVRAVGGAQP